MHIPVAFFIFNRPDLTERVFAEIARARPRKLLVVADGPRSERPGETDSCVATRAIIDRVNWDCEVLRNYSDVNLGCGQRVSTGMIWVFEQAEEAIILEDDTLPHPSFFRFCEQLLEKYRDDERVMHISGDNWLFGQKQTAYSYYFSRYCLSWGWASWRRAFRFYDPAVKLWPALRETSWLFDVLRNHRAAEHWKKVFDSTYAGIDKVDTWDFQWVFTLWVQHGLSLLPSTNLVSNIGFGDRAVHTKSSNNILANLPLEDIPFPLNHPPCMVRDMDADQLLSEQQIVPRQTNLYQKLRRKSASIIPVPVRKSISSLKVRLAPKGS